MAKTNFKKVAASRIVSWEFTAIPQSGCWQAFSLCAEDHATY